jgi:hypothetical protein
MGATHMEFAPDVAATTCPECAQDAVREAVLVNKHGLVLARGASCGHCAHQRHRVTRHNTENVLSGVLVRAASVA